MQIILVSFVQILRYSSLGFFLSPPRLPREVTGIIWCGAHKVVKTPFRKLLPSIIRRKFPTISRKRCRRWAVSMSYCGAVRFGKRRPKCKTEGLKNKRQAPKMKGRHRAGWGKSKRLMRDIQKPNTEQTVKACGTKPGTLKTHDEHTQEDTRSKTGLGNTRQYTEATWGLKHKNWQRVYDKGNQKKAGNKDRKYNTEHDTWGWNLLNKTGNNVGFFSSSEIQAVSTSSVASVKSLSTFLVLLLVLLNKYISSVANKMYDCSLCRQEALLAAISEKDANIALLELSSSKKKKTQEEVAALKREKDSLVHQLKQQVGLL